MAAEWIEPTSRTEPLRLRLDSGQQLPAQQVAAAIDDRMLQHPGAGGGQLVLDGGDWWIGVSDLRAIQERLAAAGWELMQVVSGHPHTRVSAAALGLAWTAPLATETPAGGGGEAEIPMADPGATVSALTQLTLHRGTLRSGDQLEAQGSVLVLGDVNPGARVSAAGHVLVWGRLRGVAHAGCRGDQRARIVALQLRPLQLRIADVVARGPEEPPPAGLVEEAKLVDGAIRIDAASPVWPLSG